MIRLVALASTFVLLLAAACLGLTTEEEWRYRELTRLQQERPLTGEELDEQRTLTEKGLAGGVDWEQIMVISSSIIGSLTGVYFWRGSTNRRRGAPSVPPPPQSPPPVYAPPHL